MIPNSRNTKFFCLEKHLHFSDHGDRGGGEGEEGACRGGAEEGHLPSGDLRFRILIQNWLKSIKIDYIQILRRHYDEEIMVRTLMVSIGMRKIVMLVVVLW